MKHPALPDHDPNTGDELTPSEALSHVAQSLIRRWTFIGVISVVTSICFVLGGAVLQWWNYSASWMALVIESVVGIGVFNMSKRDAVILREIRAIADEVHKNTERVEALTEEIFDHLLRIK